MTLALPSRPSERVPFVDWNTFLAGVDWLQSEHFALIGPTGCGKTTTAYSLLPLRSYVTVFATKPRDKSLERFGAEHGYKTLKEWSNSSARRVPRRILWPDARGLRSADIMRPVFEHALDAIFKAGGWCTYFDELWYMINKLKMAEDIKTFLLQSRSLDISMLMAFQRPAWVPVETYDMCTHLMFWRENDETNLSRISGIAYQSSENIREVVSDLPIHQALYINTRTGLMVRTMSPNPNGGVS